MDENKAVRDYTQQDVTEDPLIVLGCGHVLPMTSMDGYMELQRAYTTDRQGKWKQPCQLMVSRCHQINLPVSCCATAGPFCQRAWHTFVTIHRTIYLVINSPTHLLSELVVSPPTVDHLVARKYVMQPALLRT